MWCLPSLTVLGVHVPVVSRSTSNTTVKMPPHRNRYSLFACTQPMDDFVTEEPHIVGELVY